MKKRQIIQLTGILCLLTLSAAPQARSAEPVPAVPSETSRSFSSEIDGFLDDVFREREVFDENIKVKIGGQFQYRMEFRDDFNFNNDTFEDDAINLFRTRLDATVKLTDYVTFFAQGQDSESVANRGAHKSAAFVNKLDLHQLWAEVKSPIDEVPLSVKVGRQKLAYGNQRYVGGFEWSNVARVFDAVKLAYKPKDWFQFDAWFSQVVPVDREKPDSSLHNDNFWGLYASVKPIEDHTLDTFLFIRRSRETSFTGEKPGNVGPLKEYTYGNRFVGKKYGFDYNLEWAGQAGKKAQEDIGALSLHGELGYTFTKIPADPRISAEYNYGSGDSDPSDGKVETFDNLFPTNHLHYGYMDFFSLRNMHNVRIGLDAKPHKKVSLESSFHFFFLDTASSPWQNAGGAVNRAANPSASKTVGQELDLLAKWKATKHLNFLMGYSHFFAGPFVDDTGKDSDANFFYVQSVINV